jgi:hypothetical protein
LDNKNGRQWGGHFHFRLLGFYILIGDTRGDREFELTVGKRRAYAVGLRWRIVSGAEIASGESICRLVMALKTTT